MAGVWPLSESWKLPVEQGSLTPIFHKGEDTFFRGNLRWDLPGESSSHFLDLPISMPTSPLSHLWAALSLAEIKAQAIWMLGPYIKREHDTWVVLVLGTRINRMLNLWGIETLECPDPIEKRKRGARDVVSESGELPRPSKEGEVEEASAKRASHRAHREGSSARLPHLLKGGRRLLGPSHLLTSLSPF